MPGSGRATRGHEPRAAGGGRPAIEGSTDGPGTSQQTVLEDVQDLADEGFTDPTEIGRGGFAVVFRVRQPTFNRFAALKIIESSVDEDLLLRYERECRALGSVAGHPHIVTLYDAGVTTSGRPYLAMEYLPGGSLAERLAREGPMEWREAVSVGQSLEWVRSRPPTSWASCTGASSPPPCCGRPTAP